MKKTLLSLALLNGIFTFGQNPITIAITDIPQIGDQMIYVPQAITNSFEEGNAGANQFYDPIFFVENQIDTLNFVDPATTIYADEYTNSELGTYNVSDSNFRFYSIENNQMLTDGLLVSLPEQINSFLGVSNLLFAKAIDPLKDAQFPIEYESQFTDNAEFFVSSFPFFFEVSPDPYTYSDSVRANVTYQRTSIVDGWGELITPNGTYPVLRQKIQDIRIIAPEFNLYVVDTFLMQPVTLPLGYQSIPGIEFGDTTFTYVYHSTITQNNPYSVIAEINKNLQGITTSAKYAVMPSASVNELEKTIQVSCFPNPSSELVKIASESKIVSFTLVQANGKVIENRKIDSFETELNLSDLSVGNYYLTIRTEKGQVAKRISKN
jgi:hypothetical protein